MIPIFYYHVIQWWCSERGAHKTLRNAFETVRACAIAYVVFISRGHNATAFTYTHTYIMLSRLWHIYHIACHILFRWHFSKHAHLCLYTCIYIYSWRYTGSVRLCAQPTCATCLFVRIHSMWTRLSRWIGCCATRCCFTQFMAAANFSCRCW